MRSFGTWRGWSYEKDEFRVFSVLQVLRFYVTELLIISFLVLVGLSFSIFIYFPVTQSHFLFGTPTRVPPWNYIYFSSTAESYSRLLVANP